ncbi:hypothetical protein J6590_044206 [Homalodisca vitripennis]|nr:hypothetical protein J6590_044206 [Homalodisca vitripennis]
MLFFFRQKCEVGPPRPALMARGISDRYFPVLIPRSRLSNSDELERGSGKYRSEMPLAISAGLVGGTPERHGSDGLRCGLDRPCLSSLARYHVSVRFHVELTSSGWQRSCGLRVDQKKRVRCCYQRRLCKLRTMCICPVPLPY